MKKIKVLQVIAGMDMGGAETFLMNVFKNIDRNQFEFYFLCYGTKNFDYEEEIKNLGGHIIRIELSNNKNIIKNFFEFEKVIKDYNIDVVHAHTHYNSMFAVYAAHKCGVKKIITHSHSTFSEINPSLIKKIYSQIAKYIINKYSNVYLACGKDAGDALFYKKNKYEICYNGIDLEKFVYSDEIRNIKRKEININDNEIVIGHVGRFEDVKNHNFILHIFKEFLKLESKSKLVLIGDGMLKESIDRKAVELGIKDKVKILGKRKDVNYLYSTMDSFVFPSFYEGLPLTLIEAQTNGLPILASDSIDQHVNITDEVEFCSLNNSADVWANKLHEKIGKRYNHIYDIEQSKYNMKKNVYKLEEIYKED